ncbi:MAG: serine/threonine-protein kinase [Actinomycetia bacterium]|nr:serine/threonine-protein kinase [Actinomycetes bacterium]
MTVFSVPIDGLGNVRIDVDDNHAIYQPTHSSGAPKASGIYPAVADVSPGRGLVAKIVRSNVYMNNVSCDDLFARERDAYQQIFPELVGDINSADPRLSSILRCFGIYPGPVEVDGFGPAAGVLILERFEKSSWRAAAASERGTTERVALAQRVVRTALDANGFLDETELGAWRDAHPLNVLVDGKRVVICDFSHAYAPMGTDASGELITTNGTLPTRWDFAAPELLRKVACNRMIGVNWRPDPLSDLWSIGVTGYALLSQRPAGDGEIGLDGQVAELPWRFNGSRQLWPTPASGLFGSSAPSRLVQEIDCGHLRVDLSDLDQICPSRELATVIRFMLRQHP